MFDIIVKDIGDRAANHILQQLHFLNLNIRILMANQKEDAQVLRDIKTQLLKAKDEITAKIQALVDAAENAAAVDPELQSAIDDLKGVGQQLDDIVPDPVTEPPVEPPAEPPV